MSTNRDELLAELKELPAGAKIVVSEGNRKRALEAMCPFCHALMYETCRSGKNEITTVHTSRLVSSLEARR